MKNQLYQIALECQQYANGNIEIGRNKIQFRNRGIVCTDYDINGDFGKYKTLLLMLCESIKKKYPSIESSLMAHIANYDEDRIIHFFAISPIVECIVALEESTIEKKKIFISHSSKDVNIKYHRKIY